MVDRKRSYGLGTRRTQYKESKDTVGEATFAWTQNELGRFVILENTPEIQVGDSIRLFHPIPGRSHNISWELTRLTEPELIALRDIFNTAFDMALPTCIARDKEAQDALERGDDSFHRIYRPLPTVVYRKGPKQEHSEGVLHGSEDVSPVEHEVDDQHGDLRGRGDDVAEQHEGGDESKDNWPTIDQPEGFRKVDGESDTTP